MKKNPILATLLIFLSLSACGTFTGIPSHGGGKRFAIEQELVAGTTRAAIKAIDLSFVKGKNVAISFMIMGDQGAGTLLGGKTSLAAAFHGRHINTPNSQYPTVINTTTTGATTTTTESTLDNVEETRGAGYDVSTTLKLNGLSSFRNAEMLNPNDAQFLSSIMQEYLYLNGVNTTPLAQAEYVIYISVDVFGIIRSRTDWLIKNTESLKAKTAIEVAIVELKNRQLVNNPQVASYEAEYKESYVLWMGPTKIQKTIYESDDLLSDFSDILETE